MPRFVILVHDHPFLHWDFLLENGDACRAWRLPTAPDSMWNEITAEERPDHRLMYLDYEGPVSGQRGTVTRWDHGTFEWQLNQAELCEVRLNGNRWRGIVRVERDDGGNWHAVRVIEPISTGRQHGSWPNRPD